MGSTMNNRKMGNSFETELCEILAAHGFWAHNMAQNSAGQPADVIAVKNRIAYLIDCKVCSGKGFALSRIEDNQDLSMSLWNQCGNGEGWFAMKLSDGAIHMIPHKDLMIAKDTVSFTKAENIRLYVTLEQWIQLCE